MRYLLLLLLAACSFGADAFLGLGPNTTATSVSGGTVNATAVTDSGLTSGRITTAGTAGLLTDYAGLIVTGPPSTTAINAGTNAPGTTNGLILQGADATSAQIIGACFANGGSPFVNFGGFVCQGTAASPAATSSADNVSITLRGHDGTNYTASQASITLQGDGTWTPSSRPSRILFRTTPASGISNTFCGQFDQFQCFVMGSNTTSVGTYTGGTQRPHMSMMATSPAFANMAQSLWTASGTGPTQILAKSRSATAGTQSVVTTGDTAGTISFQEDDGTNFIECAQILSACTGTIATGQVPGIIKERTADSAGSMKTGYILDSAQVSCFSSNFVQTGQALYSGGTITPRVQVFGSNATTNLGSIAAAQFQNTTAGAALFLAKSRSATVGTMTLVTAGDTLGTIDYQACDGTNYVSAVQLTATVTGTPASTRAGGNLVISTGTDAAPTVMTAALTINNVQNVTHNSTVDSTSITTGGAVFNGGIGVAKRICIDGGTGKTIRVTNINANAAVAVTLGSTGCTGTTAGAPQGWMRIDINGTDRFIPFW